VVQYVAVHERGQVAYGKDDVRMGGNSDVVEHTDKSAIRGAGLPFSGLRQNGNALVRVPED
jgi:hypothetical protein